MQDGFPKAPVPGAKAVNVLAINTSRYPECFSAGTLLPTMAISDVLSQIDDQIRRLQEARRLLTGGTSGPSQSSAPAGRRGPRRMSKAARDRIAAAQRARWARQKGQGASSSAQTASNSSAPGPRRGPRRLSPAARAKIAAAQRARWARTRAQKKK